MQLVGHDLSRLFLINQAQAIHSMNSRLASLLLCLPILGLLGCGPDHGYKMASVSGVITLDGKPLPKARVTFQPSGGGPSSAGVTGPAGEYTLTGFDGDDGAVVTSHRVVIYSGMPDGQRSSDADDEDASSPPEVVPARYNSQSELIFTVQAGQKNTANFNLVSK